jgi:deoxyuridine 5'-triphosphate nucleotidohydrolase
MKALGHHDDAVFRVVDTDEKAYILGWIAGEGGDPGGPATAAFGGASTGIVLSAHEGDITTLLAARDAIDPALPLRQVGSADDPSKVGVAGHDDRRRRLAVTLSAPAVVRDVCRWLEIVSSDGERAEETIARAAFPDLGAERLQWAFVRGYFDRAGTITAIRPRREGITAPRCVVHGASSRLLDAVEAFCRIPCARRGHRVVWTGNNALDLMARLYDDARIFSVKKRARYDDWSAWVPGLSSAGAGGRCLRVQWVKCLPEARPPAKARASDSGYDLTLVQAGERRGPVQFFHTGLKLQPSYGWYLDLVPRSSLSKTGYMLANSVGVIDRSYVGEILVPLAKIDPSAPDLALPARVVQVIPRPIVHAEMVEVTSLESTDRGSGGFGSTG